MRWTTNGCSSELELVFGTLRVNVCEVCNSIWIAIVNCDEVAIFAIDVHDEVHIDMASKTHTQEWGPYALCTILSDDMKMSIANNQKCETANDEAHTMR